MLKDRRTRLASFFNSHSLDCILIEHLPNLRYLSGFSGSEAILLLTPDEGWFISDSRYTLQAQQEVDGFHLVEQAKFQEAISSVCAANRWKRIGFEAAHTTVSVYEAMKAHLQPSELVPVGAELDTIRNRKDQAELVLLEKACRLASTSLETVLGQIRDGVVESDLAIALEFEMRRRGADGRGFDFIVASGERGAMPHGRASSKKICVGELVTIDFGLVLDGYHSDETVTVSVGPPDDRQTEIYNIVKSAHDFAIEAIKPGISCKAVDAVAREYISSKGFGDYFGHGLGHGVGLEIHEKPVLSPRSDAVLEQGMVVTVEPGIYIPGWGGVRIEDTVAVTADCCHLLTSVSKEMIVV
jgi:Xaa-Pro aminopeptidase